ncbi:hypothetical protein Goe4_c00231 [Bacillus phage vB_BthP-Goe4]|uniref:Uncharacterized protein n=1 Tax=Bacillus phage vB_BthP-Goe4 TaxID=2315470 RepID=A0A3G5ALA7_9CAUD|nr:hypothetical protein H3015_gp20 [Bacillus phage vB_BthP-Goe4]AYV87824.1 hypothetical protein Goe4_c00231 [Bacillus phage vB_BthP-Goe4]
MFCKCYRCGKIKKREWLRDQLCLQCIYELTRYLNRKW